MASSPLGISDLPDEILCEVFSKLTPEDVLKYALNVCKRWNTIVKENQSFWSNLQLTVDCDFFFGSLFLDRNGNYYHGRSEFINEVFIGEQDLEKVSSLRCIKFVGGGYSNESCLLRIMDVIRKFCKNLEKFEFLICCAATFKYYFMFLREHYSNITEIRFRHTLLHNRIPYTEISKFHNITSLVSQNYAFERSALTVLADNCSSLTCLWILLSRSIRVDDMLYFLDKKKTVLKELGVGMNLHDCILEKLKECQRLEVLFAADARYVTDKCIKSFCNLPKLKYCSLHGTVFELETVLGLIKGAPSRISSQLLILDLTGYGNHGKYESTVLHQEDYFKNMIKESKYLTTFTNDVNSAIKIPWCQKSPLHWMYRNESILRNFRKFKLSH